MKKNSPKVSRKVPIHLRAFVSLGAVKLLTERKQQAAAQQAKDEALNALYRKLVPFILLDAATICRYDSDSADIVIRLPHTKLTVERHVEYNLYEEWSATDNGRDTQWRVMPHPAGNGKPLYISDDVEKAVAFAYGHGRVAK